MIEWINGLIGGHPLQGQITDFKRYHGHSVAYNTQTNEWFSNNIDDDDNDGDMLPPVIPTLSLLTGRGPRSVITKDHLWIRALTDDNTLHCYNIVTRTHSIIPLKQAMMHRGEIRPRPDRLLTLANGWILMISYHYDEQSEKVPFQLLNPHTHDIYALTDVTLPPSIRGEIFEAQMAIIDKCDSYENELNEQYFIIANGHSADFDTNIFYAATISFISQLDSASTKSPSGASVSSESSKSPCQIGAWQRIQIPLPSDAYRCFMRCVIN
jgi:hypothetical protein